MKPILSNTEMVRAILDGRKTVTRRVVKPQPIYSPNDGFSWKGAAYGTDFPPTIRGAAYNFQCASPYRPGDILYVKETFRTYCGMAYEWVSGVQVPFDDFEGYNYRADDFHLTTGWFDPLSDSDGEIDHKCEIEYSKWRPSIHMPHEAARIFLRVTNVRVERLQDITEKQAELEGCCAGCSMTTGGPWGVEDDPETWTAREDVSKLWDSTIKKAGLPLYGWEANPWVWVIPFERISREEAAKNES